ncbi:MAG: hypothetical protein QMC96_12500 [Methanomicrobiales archaeon]|nr:hypothetical protein [Methanomicrobiales archaeon]
MHLVRPRTNPNITAAVEGFAVFADITGIPQVLTGTVTAGATANGTLVIRLTANGMTGSPIDTNVPVLQDDDVAAVAEKIAEELGKDTDIAAWFDIAVDGAAIVLTRKTWAENDATMAIAVQDADSTSVAMDSDITTEGTLYDFCDLVIPIAGTYVDEVPVTVGIPQLEPGDGAACTKIESWEIVHQTEERIEVRVRLDTAPGAGKSATVSLYCGLLGQPVRR